MIRDLEKSLREMRDLADEAIASSDYSVPSGKLTLVQRLGKDLQADLDHLEEAIRGNLSRGGSSADRDREFIAHWTLRCRDQYWELRFTMNDPFARRVALGGAHKSDEYALELAAFRGRKQRTTAKENAAGERNKWARELAKELAAQHKNFPGAWETLPEGEIGYYAGFEVYRDGNALGATEDQTGQQARTISKESFRTSYFSPAKRGDL